MIPDQKLSYCPEGAAKVTDSSRSRIYRAMRTGELKSYKDGRSRRISRKALEEYVARLERESAGRAA